MVYFEVSLNGDVICSAGNEKGSVHVDVMRMPFSSDAEINVRDYMYHPASTGGDLAPKLRSALQHPERPSSVQPVYWIDRKKLKVGDEITIRLIEVPGSAGAAIPESPSVSN